jgi:hypothetical protein
MVPGCSASLVRWMSSNPFPLHGHGRDWTAMTMSLLLRCLELLLPQGRSQCCKRSAVRVLRLCWRAVASGGTSKSPPDDLLNRLGKVWSGMVVVYYQELCIECRCSLI